MHYTVCFLFDRQPSGSRVLLQRKDRTDFAGRLNGVGGKFKQGETALECALREIREETGARPEGLVWLGDYTPSDNCDGAHRDEPCELHFFAGLVGPDAVSQQPGETERLEWHDVGDVLRNPMDPDLAGDGDVWYFINRASRMLGVL